MVVREAGILFRGFTLINASYHQTSGEKIDMDLRSGLLTALLNFAENAFSTESVEYFEGSKYVIAFVEEEIFTEKDTGRELLIAYAILDKEKNIGKYVRKIIFPMLKQVLKQFKENNKGKDLCEISQFSYFKENLDNIFGSDIKTVDQKLEGLFFG